jgi:hypothetical protein
MYRFATRESIKRNECDPSYSDVLRKHDLGGFYPQTIKGLHIR